MQTSLPHRLPGPGKPPGAAAASRDAQHARAAWQAGQRHAAAERWADAERSYREACRLAPGDALYALNQARALLRLGRMDDAAQAAERAFRIDPLQPVSCALWAHCLMEARRPAQAAAALRELPAQVPRDADYHATLGRALQYAGRTKEAIAAYFDALAIRIDQASVHYQMGVCFNDLGLKEEAAQCFHTALALGIGGHELGVRGLLSYFEREVCRWTSAQADLDALLAALRALPDDVAAPTTPFAHVTLFDDPADQLKAARHAARLLLRGVTPLPAPAPRSAAERAGRIRIGYVSADFHTHATSILMAEMLEQHDRSRFEVTLYSHGADDGTPMRRRVEAACEHFVDVHRAADRDVVERIRADGIDVLVDLKGWTKDNRLGLFAWRAARVQATFLGFPGSTGAPFIDYLIGDDVVAPMVHAAHFSETLAHLPLCYQPNDRQRARPEPLPRSQLGLPDDALVLCGFNQPFKISAEVFDTWCGLLRQLPGAVLWLLEWNSQVQANITHEANKRGIDPRRIVWAPRMQPARHMARLGAADLFIDTWPCNAHTTASDALWAGVPVVTWMGETFASRVAGSLNRAAGLHALVCASRDAYVARILELAADAPRRRALRAQLLAARDTSPLFDSTRFARDIEALYVRMLERHDAGLAPAPLAAA